MKKKFYKILLFLLLFMPVCVNAADYLLCGNDRKVPLVFGQILSIVFILVRILVPILLVIMSMFSFIKAVVSGKIDDELARVKQVSIQRIVAAVLIFFIFSIVNFVINLSVSTNNSFSSCLYCLFNSDHCESADDEIAKLCPGLISDQENYDENCNYVGSRKGKVNYADTGDTGVPAYGNGNYSDGNNSGSSSSNGLTGDFLNWKQCDPKWGGVTMGPSSVSLCRAGCTTTSISILMAKSGAVTDMSNFTPATLAKTLQYGRNGNMSYWDDYNSWKSYAPSFRFVALYGLSGSISDKASKIKSYLDDGKYVMIVVNYGGHYVAADRVEGNTVYIHDPGGNKTDLFKSYAAASVQKILVYKREG